MRRVAAEAEARSRASVSDGFPGTRDSRDVLGPGVMLTRKTSW